MLKGFLKAGAALAIGFLTTVAGCGFVALHKWPSVMSNERLVALLLAPIVIGVVVGVGVYRILDS